MTTWTMESGDTYTIQRHDSGLVTITCLPCGLSSTHPMDIAQRWCPCCGRYLREGGRQATKEKCPHG